MTTIKDAVDDLFNNPRLSAADAIDRHFAPTFRQRTNGHRDDRAAFAARLTLLREVVEHATVTVLDELSDGARYAERHVIDLLKRDGERVVQEVFLFAERDGEWRFVWIEEVSVGVDR